MSDDDKYKKKKKKKLTPPQDDTGRGEGDTGGDSGGSTDSGIEFHDFLGAGLLSREETLSESEKKRLLSTHDNLHKSLVEKQKKTREERKALKEGKKTLNDYRQGLQGAASQYRSHPILSQQAQFSGIDRQVNTVPTEHLAETNQEKGEELKYQYNLTHRPQHAMKFNPKPQIR